MSVTEIGRKMDCGCVALRRLIDGRRMVVVQPCSLICPNYNELRQSFAKGGVKPQHLKDQHIDEAGRLVDNEGKPL